MSGPINQQAWGEWAIMDTVVLEVECVNHLESKELREKLTATPPPKANISQVS